MGYAEGRDGEGDDEGPDGDLAVTGEGRVEKDIAQSSLALQFLVDRHGEGLGHRTHSVAPRLTREALDSVGRVAIDGDGGGGRQRETASRQFLEAEDARRVDEGGDYKAEGLVTGVGWREEGIGLAKLAQL